MLPIERRGLTHKIRHICAQGYQDYDAGRYQSALRQFYQAWLALPKPQRDWPEAAWVLTAIGDTYFRLERYAPGAEALRSALYCPDGDWSAFTHLRLGQCYWELGQEAKARQSLFKAYQIARTDIFDGEHKRYRRAIADLLPEAQS